MIEERRLTELAHRAAYASCPVFSHFLEPSMIPMAENCAKQAGVYVLFSGGYENAERMMAAFSMDREETAFPITCLSLSWNEKYGSVGHRDLLGTVMGLGIAREATGDIVVADAEAYLFCEQGMARYIAENLTSAGRVNLNVTEKAGGIVAPEPKGVRIRITFSAPRLDAILSAGYGLSRGEAQKMIAAGLVKRNHIPEQRTDAQIEAGDLLSVRGLGRLKVEQMLGETKKGRRAAGVFRYGK